MSAITPSTNLFLIKSPIEIDLNNQINFSNSENQANYFRSLPHVVVEDISYQRKEGIIRFPAHIDSILGYNYCMYKNENYGNKWFYAFIEDMTYLNDNVTAIKIKTDPYQTWMFEMQLKPSFVEREHVNNDTIGLHTIPENLEYGQYICLDSQHFDIASSKNTSSYKICVQLTEATVNDESGGKVLNGIMQGVTTIAFDPIDSSSRGLAQLHTLIGVYDGLGKADAIVSMFAVPSSICNWTETQVVVRIGESGGTVPCYTANTTNERKKMGEVHVTRENAIEGYVPRNNKLKVFPYSYFTLSNHGGEMAEYHFEDFYMDSTYDYSAQFEILGSITQGCSIRCSPRFNYKKNGFQPTADSSGYDYGVSAIKLPTFSWVTDYYMNWLASNAKPIEARTASQGFGAIATGLATMNPVAGLPNLIQGVTESMAQKYQASIVPDQLKGEMKNADLAFASSGIVSFEFDVMSIRREYAEILDKYFDMFGYKVNDVKVPNVTGRRNWNYVKTVDCNIEGNVPQMYIQQLKQMFNKGVTIWHNPNTFLDYSQSNSIL